MDSVDLDLNEFLEKYVIFESMVVLQVLLKRGIIKDGFFFYVFFGLFDYDLFIFIWGLIVVVLFFVFDKSLDELIIQKVIVGFRYVQYMYICKYIFCYSDVYIF